MRNMLNKSWSKFAVAAAALVPSISFADGATSGALGPWGVPAAVLGIALAVIACSSAQGKIATAYMDGASRNPGAEKAMKTQLILSLVFVETLVIFTLGVVFVLIGKI